MNSQQRRKKRRAVETANKKAYIKELQAQGKNYIEIEAAVEALRQKTAEERTASAG